MLPRRSLRIRQLNSQTASNAIASSSADATTKLTSNPAKKRARTKNDVSVQPKQKKIKLNIDENNSIAFGSTSSAKNGHLDSLPTEVLEQIFIKADDIGLLSLADTCTRFEAIALAVASKRYSNKCFVINSERYGGDPDIYTEIFNRFGAYINAIEVNDIRDIDDKNHWLAKMLQPHINHITQLTLDTCTFRRKNIFSLVIANMTHLVLRRVSLKESDFDLFKCRNLIKLDIRRISNMPYGTADQIICDNPDLQSISCYGINLCLLLDSPNAFSQIKNLAVLNLNCDSETLYQSGALQNLESLELNLNYEEIDESLQCLSVECKQIKHLKLNYDDEIDWNIETIEAIRTFQQVESLYIDEADYKIVSVVKHLPNLRHLRMKIPESAFLHSNTLQLFCECPSLEKITIVKSCCSPEEYVCPEFFEEFISTIGMTGKSNIRIEIEDYKEPNKIIATVTENGIVWRNKLMHWMGCDHIPETSNTHLLDLANGTVKFDIGRKSTKKQRRNAVQTSLLDRIFDYLDVTSLYFFAKTSSGNKKLVENYIKMHSKQNGTFTVTDEFYSFFDDNSMHSMFESHVTNLHVYFMIESRAYFFNKDFILDYKCLTKVTIHCDFVERMELPSSVRHIVIDGSQFIDSIKLKGILHLHSGIDTLELKKAGIFNGVTNVKKNDMKLKKLIFNYRNETQLKNLTEMFKGTKTKLVPIFPNSNHI